jgi:guanylate kinase
MTDDTNLRPVVFCGPSGVGKGTLIEMLMKHFPNNQFGFSVSHTTRLPREGEVDGVHYNFTTVDAIKNDIADGKFIEYAEVHGKYYGTRWVRQISRLDRQVQSGALTDNASFYPYSIKAVESVQQAGKICVLDIDVQGVQKVKESSLSPLYLFIAPPSIEELEKRLRGRGTETEEAIRIRLGNSAKELDYGQAEGNFDRIFVNSDLNECFAGMVQEFKVWFPHLTE